MIDDDWYYDSRKTTWSGGYAHKSTSDATQSCNCVGARNGQPLCPCAMQGVVIINGRYVRIQDFGPVRNEPPADRRAVL